MKFKESLIDPSLALSSWNSSKDCCTWRGIRCDKFTGHVIGVDLGFKIIHYEDSLDEKLNYDGSSYELYIEEENKRERDVELKRLKGNMLDASLLELKHLTYLDMSWMDFNHSSIPAFLGSMKQLQHLNFSHVSFAGIVPHHLGNLSNLRVLDLNEAGDLIVDDFIWVSRLSQLEHLDMSFVDLSQTKDLVKVLHILPSLVVLIMSNSRIDKINLQHTCVVNSSLSIVQHLDLSWNSIYGDLPCFLQNMTSLRYLDLSMNQYNSSSFYLHRLTNLVHLNLGSNSFQPNVEWISEFLLNNKCHLESLDLSYNQFYGEISAFFQNSSGCWKNKLERVLLRGNHFYGHLPKEMDEIKKLMYLDLSYNSLNGSIPASLGRLSPLTELHLGYNKLFGSIPSSLGRLSDLAVLELGSNNLSGSIPSSLGNLRALRTLNLNGNQLTGQIPYSFGNLSFLRELYLIENNISGPIPSSLGNLRALRILNLNGNNLSGPILPSFGNLSFLRALDLSENSHLTGEIPISFGQLSNLELLDLRSTSLHGTVYESHFDKLSKLRYLRISSFIFRARFGWSPPFQLIQLMMQSCDVGGQFPQWLQMQKELNELQLANCSIAGTLPNWIHYMNLTILDLSNNHITGPIPSKIGYMLPNLDVLLLNQNNFNGTIPTSLCKMSLTILDISRNRLSGSLPNCWENFPFLSILFLSSNNFSGVIPNSIGGAQSLKWLHLNNNSFTGKLPFTLRNCSSLIVLDIGDNKLSGNLPIWLGNDLSGLGMLRIRNNEFYGTIPSQFCKLIRLQIIDFANNNLSGIIPSCIGDIKSMINKESTLENEAISREDSLIEVLKGLELEYSTTAKLLFNLDLSNNNLVGEIPIGLTNLSGLIGLNLSHNHLEGKIPERIGDMKSLESLDFSWNNLLGPIPQSLTNLSSLSHLNLSYNKLSGQIPTGRQLQTLSVDPSIYEGNPQLCGDPLPKKCHTDKAIEDPNMETHESEDQGWSNVDKIWLYGFIISGFATGFWGVIGVLVFKISWRHAYCKFAERVGRMLLHN